METKFNNYHELTPSAACAKKQSQVEKDLKLKECELKINGELLTSERKAILALSFRDLLNQLKEGKLQAVEVLKAFQAKALEETKRTNCITEFIPKAETWASERDKTPHSKRGLLHGLPLSVKENFDIEGMDTTLGLTKRLGKPLAKNATMIDIFLQEGAIPFVKTNVPQLIYSMGCGNPIFGATLNPYNLDRSPGGSSGGEAALIVGGGSYLGVGTDMMGSVRIPASFCGTNSIKPTQKRITREGCHGNFKQLVGIANTSGLLGRDIDALAVGMEALLTSDTMFKLDPNIPPVHWRSDQYRSNKKLRIGWFDTTEFFPVTPGCRRAVTDAKVALEKMGHTAVPFNLPDVEELWNFGIDLLVSEGGSAFLKHWEGGEIVDDSVKFNKKVLAAPSWIKSLLGTYMSFWSPLLAKMASQNASKSSELWATVCRRKEYLDRLIQQWKDADIDVLLGPAFPCLAPHPKHHGNLLAACIYFAFYNLVDFPSGTIPVTFETQQDQKELDNYSISGDFVFKCVKETCEGGLGMPLSVQIGALPFQEETVLYAMKELERAIRK